MLRCECIGCFLESTWSSFQLDVDNVTAGITYTMRNLPFNPFNEKPFELNVYLFSSIADMPFPIAVHPSKDIYSIGDEITAFAKGNPPSRYTWIDPTSGKTLGQRNTFAIAKHHPPSLLVIAWNTIFSHTYRVNMTLTINGTLLLFY